MESKELVTEPVAEIKVTDREFGKLVVTRSVVLEGRKGEKGKVSFAEGDIMNVICHSSQIEPPNVKVIGIKVNDENNKLVDIEVKLLRHSV